jgi:hypothetical protein
MHGSFAMLPQARRWAIVYIALYFSAVPGRAAPFLSGVPADVTVECGAVPAPPEVTAYGYLPGQSFGGLVLYYSFDRPDGGQVMDDSGHSRTGHVNGATWIPEGRCGGAYRFDTINQNITASDAGLPSGDAPRSVAAWIKLNQAYPNNSTEYFSYGTRSYNQLTSLGLDWRLDRDRFNFSQYGGVFLTQQRMEQTGVWYHVVYTYGGAGAHAFYINGVRTDGLNELRGAIQTQLSGLLMLGGHPQNAGSLGPDGGFLDEVMVFDRVLTGLEAQRLAQRSGGSLPVIYSEREEGICPQVIQRVWSATDAIGNTVSATQTITVVDTTPPVLVGVPEDAIIECGAIMPEPPVVTAQDGCGAPQLPAGAVVNEANGHLYAAVTGLVTWSQASNLARVVVGGVTGHLATITSSQEQAFVRGMLPISNLGGVVYARLGGFDQGSEGSWRWITGEPYTFGNWFNGEPNGATLENFLSMVVVGSGRGHWNDTADAANPACAMYVIEWDRVQTTGTTAVTLLERTNGACPAVITRVWSAADACGNTVSATQTITVVDTTAPVLAGVPEDMTIECGEAEPVPPVVTAYDTCGGSSAVTAPTNGLVLYYSFDSDPGSVIADESGTGNQGVRQGCTWVVDGYRGGALRFDGVSDHLRVANTPSINSAAFTVSAWVKSEQAQAEVDAGIFGKHRQHDNVNSWWVHQAQDAIRTPIWGQFYGSFVNTRVPLGGAIQEWFMASATYDGQKIRLYIDGVLREEQAITGYTGNGYDLLIGSGEFAWEGGGAQRLWKGLIDEPRMYNRVLSEAEVEQLYRAATASSGLAVQYVERRSGDACSLRIERVWSATDACGNAASATQTITVVDTMSPVLVMPSSMELEATASCGAVLACCTRGLGYWKNHPDLWPLDTVLVMGQPWSKMDALRVLWTPPSGDPTYLLVHQLIPALLNTANSCSGETWRVMADLLSDAQTWLTEHSLGSNELSAVEREMTLQLAAQLEDFNEGVTGPGVCREKKLRGGSPMPGCATLPDLTSKAVASDGCSDVTLTQAPAPGVEIPVGSSLEVSIQAEDACGNRTSGVMVVSVPLRPPMLAQDPDTDGMTTGDELIAGSDAASAASVFAVSEMVVQDDGVCCVRWDSAPNRSYIIETSAYLDGPYTSVATKRPTSPGKTEYRHLTTEDGPRFYRVRALIE